MRNVFKIRMESTDKYLSDRYYITDGWLYIHFRDNNYITDDKVTGVCVWEGIKTAETFLVKTDLTARGFYIMPWETVKSITGKKINH